MCGNVRLFEFIECVLQRLQHHQCCQLNDDACDDELLVLIQTETLKRKTFIQENNLKV